MITARSFQEMKKFSWNYSLTWQLIALFVSAVHYIHSHRRTVAYVIQYLCCLWAILLPHSLRVVQWPKKTTKVYSRLIWGLPTHNLRRFCVAISVQLRALVRVLTAITVSCEWPKNVATWCLKTRKLLSSSREDMQNSLGRERLKIITIGRAAASPQMLKT